MLFRRTNESCFTCGAQVPNDLRYNEDGPFRWLECPDCRYNVIQGIIRRGGSVERIPFNVPMWIPDEAKQLPEGLGWVTWEMWWSDERSYVTMINGKTTHGDDNFREFVEKLLSIANDDS